MSGHVLIATDLSERSTIAVERGLALARARSAHCTVLYVIDEDKPKELIKQKMDYISGYLEKQMEEMRSEDMPEPDIIIRVGRVHDVINKTAEEKHSRLIVMGAPRKNILLDVLRGTTIERVMQTVSIPVLMVNRPIERGYKSVVFGIDTDLASKNAIDTAFAYGLASNAQLTVVHAYHDLAKAQMNSVEIDPIQVRKHEGEYFNKTANKLDDFLSETLIGKQSYQLVFEETAPSGLIVKVANELDADLIVVGTRSLSGIRKLLLGSVAEGVLRNAQSDVLAVPPKA